MYSTLLAAVAIISLALYIPAREERATRFSTTWLDRRIPFVPVFVVAYIGFAFLLPIAFIALSYTAQWESFLIALIISAFLYIAASPLAGYGATHADALGRGVSRRLVQALYRLDGAAF